MLAEMDKIDENDIEVITPIILQSVKGSKGELKKKSDTLLESFLTHHGDVAGDYLPAEILQKFG
jgi:hypothetical protein